MGTKKKKADWRAFFAAAIEYVYADEESALCFVDSGELEEVSSGYLEQ